MVEYSQSEKYGRTKFCVSLYEKLDGFPSS